MALLPSGNYQVSASAQVGFSPAFASRLLCDDSRIVYTSLAMKVRVSGIDDLPLDAATAAWLGAISLATGAPVGTVIATMLRDIREDDEAAHRFQPVVIIGGRYGEEREA